MRRLKIMKEQYMPYVKTPKHDTAFMIDFLTSKCDCTPQASDFKLFQTADLICTLVFLEQKIQNSELTRSEQLLFHSKRDLKKDFLKGIHKKQF